jgi:hypothetical protein
MSSPTIQKALYADSDRGEFSFNHDYTPEERLEMLRRNPSVQASSLWFAQEALHNRWTHASQDEVQWELLDEIDFLNKAKLAITYCRTFGHALMVFHDGPTDDIEQDRGPDHIYSGCDIYYPIANSCGYRVEPRDFDGTGTPKIYTLSYVIEGADMKQVASMKQVRRIPASRCVHWNNPRLVTSWHGTPTIDLVLPYAYAEELLYKALSKRAIKAAGGIIVATNVQSAEVAQQLVDKIDGGQADTIPLQGETEISWVGPQFGASEYDVFLTLIRNMIARGIRISAQALDGAPEGTLSSAQYNSIYAFKAIVDCQVHFKPYLTQSLQRLGIEGDIEMALPVDELDLGNPEESAPGESTPEGGSESQP